METGYMIVLCEDCFGRHPSLDDYEGTWECLVTTEVDDTNLDLTKIEGESGGGEQAE
jgi:hypothetical protein